MIKSALLSSALTALAPFSQAATPRASFRGAIAEPTPPSVLETEVLGGCQEQDHHAPIFHFTNEDRDVIRQYKSSHGWLLNDLSAHKANGKYGVHLKDESVYQYVAEGDFVFWGVKHGHSVSSAWNTSTSVEEFFQVLGAGSHSWHYDARAPFYLSESDSEKGDYTIKSTTVLDDGGNYVAFPSFFQDADQDLVLMDYLGYVGFLRSALPQSVKLLLVTNNKHQHKEILERLDPDFAKTRVHWIDCGDELEQCNQHVKIRNGGNLELFKPPFVSKSEELLWLAKRLIQYRYPKQTFDGSSNNNSIVYLRDKNLPVRLEKVLLAQVERHLLAFGRPETLIIYEDSNGYHSFLRKLQLLQEANIVIGVTSELMNALPFIKANESLSCDDRVKLLEVVTPPDDSPQLSWSSSRHLLLTTYPNVELHNVLLDIDDEDEDKDRHDTFLEGTSVQLALQSMLRDGNAAAVANDN
jgi:hypothetical protein